MARRVGISTIQQANSLPHDDSFSQTSAHRQRPHELDQLDELETGKEDYVATTTAATTKSRRPSFGKMNKNMQDWLKEQKRSQASCRSLPFTATFYVVFVMTQLAHRKVQTVYTMQTSMRDALVTGVVPAPMPLDVVRSGTTPLPEVTSWADLLNWMDQTMVPFMWNTGDGGPGIVMEMNRLIGGARVQQQRLKIGDCPGPSRLADSYGTWISSSENSHCTGSELETSPIVGVQVEGSLLQGDVANDEGWYTYWLDAALNQTAILGHVDALRQAHWPALTAQTVRIQSALHCGQVGMFALIEVLVSMDRVGAMTPLIKVKALPTQVYTTSRGALVGLSLVIGDATFFAMLVWLLLGELLSLRKRVSDDQDNLNCCTRILKRFFRFHTLITWAVIMFGMGFSAWSGWLMLVLEDFAKQVLEVVDLEGSQGSIELGEMHIEVNSVYDRLVYLTDRMNYYELATFWYMLLMLMMFLRNFQANKRLAVITETLRLAMGDLIHFFIIFFLVFMNFVLGAYFLFGQSLKEWSKLSLAANTGFRALMGDFDFAEMYKIAPFNATVWFWSYMIFIFLIMINMALAIVMDAYAKVKENSRGAETIIGMVKRECKEKWVWMKHKLGKKSADTDADDEDDSDAEAAGPSSPVGGTDDGDCKLQELTGEVADISKALLDLLAAHGLSAPSRRDIQSATATSRGMSMHQTLTSFSERDAASQYGKSRVGSTERSFPASEAGTVGPTTSQATNKQGASRVSSTSTMNTSSEKPSSPKSNAVVVKAATESQRRTAQQSETMPAPPPRATGNGNLRRTAQQAETMPTPQPRVAVPQDSARRPDTVPGVPDHNPPRAEADEKVEAWAEMMSRYGVNMDPVAAKKVLKPPL